MREAPHRTDMSAVGCRSEHRGVDDGMKDGTTVTLHAIAGCNFAIVFSYWQFSNCFGSSTQFAIATSVAIARCAAASPGRTPILNAVAASFVPSAPTSLAVSSLVGGNSALLAMEVTNRPNDSVTSH